MDLYSDFKEDKWVRKGSPPQKLSIEEGYENQNIMRTTKEDSDDGPVFTYYTSSDGGVPNHALLYGAKRDPLKGIGHCGMRLVVKNYVTLITGCIVEEDWAEMKQTYLESLKVQGTPPKEDKPMSLSMVIGLISDLKNDKWVKKEDPPRNKTALGYGYFTIIREHMENGTRTYYINNSEGRPMEAYLENSERDPLRSIGNCYLKLVKENNKEMIKGIIFDDDWVEAK